MRLQPLGRRWSALLAVATVVIVNAVVIATAPAGPASATPIDTRQPTVTSQRQAASVIQVYFYNQYKSTVYVAVGEWSPNRCEFYGRFLASGWWPINPGEKVHVANSENQTIMWYAESHDGATWSGDGSYRSWLGAGGPWSNCWTVEQGSPWRAVSFREGEMGDVDSFTFNITP
jgi:hypothetical protein